MVDDLSHFLPCVKYVRIQVFYNPYFPVGKIRVRENLCSDIFYAVLFLQKSFFVATAKSAKQPFVMRSTEAGIVESSVCHGRQFLFTMFSDSMELQ